ncbi:hypothetical protein LX83_001228 [Goodfellowiella coeruleoviolacea]|uniref:Uncharacterized protein n=2 Tax=Goodfellowiella coeruleoviolacea TaxID=334858 RepID=A0AAE3GAT2_9PSEU|nr:hypothetical protein [Goodfellowiella coeruleoviolacea]
MAKGRNNLLGVGGQRRKMSRSARQGAPGYGPGSQADPLSQKQELLRKLRERAEGRTGDQDAAGTASKAEDGAAE